MKLPSRATLYYWFISFLELQLLINCVSLPVLAYWGLPISWLSPVGNLFFTPVLTLFLLLSSLIFFAGLLHIPHGAPIILLEYLQYYWAVLLSYGSPYWLSSFIKPPLWATILFVLTSLALYYAVHKKSCLKRLRCIIIILSAFIIILRYAQPSSIVHEISGMHGSIKIIGNKNGISVIDQCCYTNNPQNFIDYTFMNALRSQTGSTRLEQYSITKPTATSMRLARLALKHCSIKKMLVPYWQGDDKKIKRLFMALKKEAHNVNCALLRKKI